MNNERWQLSARDVFRRKAIHGFQLSPDGRQFSFVNQHDKRVDEINENGRLRITETALSDICLLPSDGGYPRLLTHSSDVGGPSDTTRVRDYSSPAVWSPDGRWLALEREGSLQVMAAAGGESRILFRGRLYHALRRLEPGDAYIGYPRWSHDGQYILFASREDSQTVLRLVSADGKLQRVLFTLEGDMTGWDWSPDDRRILFGTRTADGWLGSVRMLDVGNAEANVLWEEDNFEYQKPIVNWAPDGTHIVFRSNRSGWSKLWTANAEGGAQRPLTQGEWDDYAYRFSPDGNHIVYASRAEQSGSGDDLWSIALQGGGPQRLTHHPGVNVPVAWSPDHRIYYWHTSPVEPGDLWVTTADGAEPRRLTWGAPIELEQKLSAPEETIVVNEDGTRIPVLIYLPVYHQAGEKHPAIVWIHGGPTDVVRYEFAPFHNWLANLGFVVITPNYRGSIGYGVRHMAAVTGDGVGSSDVSDVLAVGRFARTLPYVDLSRGVGVGGRSYGGYLTLMAITEAPDLFSCAVAGSAITDWEIQQSEVWVRYFNHWLLGGWVYEEPERTRERSPVCRVERIKIPLLMYHGDDDYDAVYSQIPPFVEAARRAGVDLEYLTYYGEAHVNKKLANQQDTFDRRRAFYNRHLKPWNLTDNPRGGQIHY